MVRRILILILAFSCHLLRGQSFVITNVNVIPMTGDPMMVNQSVLIVKGKIKKIGPAGYFRASKRALEINGEGKYLMPGLVDMHMHYLADSQTLASSEVEDLRKLRDRWKSLTFLP